MNADEKKELTPGRKADNKRGFRRAGGNRTGGDEKRGQRQERGFRNGDAKPGRAFRNGDAKPERDFKHGDAKPERDFKRGDAKPERDFKRGDAKPGRGFKHGDAKPGHAFRNGDAKPERTFRNGDGKPERGFKRDIKPVEPKPEVLTEPFDEPVIETGTENREHKVYDPVRVLRAGTEQKLLSLLGFAARGRKLVAGTDLCRDSVRRGHAIVTIVVSDASANTKKRIIDACKYYRSDMCVAPVTSAELSHRIGKTGEIMVVSVTDIHFADGIAALFESRPGKDEPDSQQAGSDQK